jgi:hypothetical protein
MPDAVLLYTYTFRIPLRRMHKEAFLDVDPPLCEIPWRTELEHPALAMGQLYIYIHSS